MNSPYKTIDVDVTLPTIGSIVAKAYVESGVIESESGKLPGVTDVKFPIDAFNKGVDLESLAKELIHDLNTLPEGGLKREAYALSDSHKISVKQTAIYQVVEQNKMLQAGIFDIDESAILTQDQDLAYAAFDHLHNGYNVVDVMKELGQLTPSEMNRVSNNKDFIVAQGKVQDALDRYDIQSHTRLSNCNELVMQRLMDLPLGIRNEIEKAFSGVGTVKQAFQRMADSPVLNPRYNDSPFEFTDEQNKLSNKGLYVSFDQDVAETSVGFELTNKNTGEVTQALTGDLPKQEAQRPENRPSLGYRG